MKEILKDKEEEIVKLRTRCNALESENKLYKEELKARLNKIDELQTDYDRLKVAFNDVVS
jgi:chromosome segregation ATPase